MEKIERRKNQHLQYALEFHSEQNPDWEGIDLPLCSFPELDIKEIELTTQVMGFSLRYPFYINAMTGGSEQAEEWNRSLAILARECDLMLAMGSYSIALQKNEAKSSFAVIRREAPNICLGVNLGADKTVSQAQRAVEESEADFLQIHVNPLQELIMLEGERSFCGWLKNIEEMVRRVKVPVMVKQVGFGMSRADIERLAQIGVRTIDISGSGGTDFAKIENARRQKPYLALGNLGISTPDSLRSSRPFQQSLEILASGGIKNALHIAKALSLGAKAAGIAGQILYLLKKEGLEQTIAELEHWKQELTRLYLICGVKSTVEMNRLAEREQAKPADDRQGNRRRQTFGKEP